MKRGLSAVPPAASKDLCLEICDVLLWVGTERGEKAGRGEVERNEGEQKRNLKQWKTQILKGGRKGGGESRATFNPSKAVEKAIPKL